MSELRPFFCYNEIDGYFEESLKEGHMPLRGEEALRAEYFDRSGCSYCEHKLTEASFQHVAHTYNIKDAAICNVIRYCDCCGWWKSLRVVTDNEARLLRTIERRRLKSFDIASLALPFEQLLTHLARHPQDLRVVHPRRVEELVQAIFREHLMCSAELTKQTRDGGYDLICFSSERGKFLIEVKRGSKGSVSIVREFAGVLLREEVKAGIIVSTGGFTKPAKSEADEYGRNGRRHRLDIELRDATLITDYLGLLREREASSTTLPDCELRRRLESLASLNKKDMRLEPGYSEL